MKLRQWWIGGICVVALALSACGGDAGGTANNGNIDAGTHDARTDVVDDAGHDSGPDAEPDPGPVACVPDPQLIVQQTECVRDEHCPCGTSCRLGRCQATCREDSECADGQYCDEFGQCRDAADTNKVALGDHQDQGRLEPQRTIATITSQRPVASTAVRAAGGPVDRARLVAGEGLLVAVTGGDEPAEGDYAEDVLLDASLERDATLRMWVKRDPNHPDEQPVTGEVTLFDSGGNRSMMTVTEDTVVLDGAAQTELAGVYTGVARLVSRGSVGGVGQNLAHPMREKSVPLAAKLFDTGSEMRVVIEDSLRVLHPGGEWIGTLSADARALELPAFEALSLEQIALSNSQVIATPTDVRVEGEPGDAGWDGVLRFGFDLSYRGVADSAAIPTSRWVVTIARTGDLPEGEDAPDGQQSVQLAYDTGELADTPFNAEMSLASLTFAYPDLTTKWASIRATADNSLSGQDMQACAHPLFPFSSVEDRQEYYKQFNRTVFADALVANVEYQGPDPSWDAFYAWPVEEDETGQTMTLAGIAALGVPMLSEIFAAITPQSTVVYRAHFALASGFPDRVLGGANFDYAPPITLPDGTTIDYALPCDYDFTASPDVVSFSDGVHQFDVPNKVFDFCQSAADRLDCEIIDVSSQLTPDERDLFPGSRDWELTIAPGDSFFDQERAYVPDVRFNKVCVPPRIPSRCAEGLACESARSDTSDLSEFARLSSSGQGAASGDLACGDTGRIFGYGMDEPELAADVLVADCISDSQALETPLPMPVGSTNGEKLTSIGWYDDYGCFNPVQIITGVAKATDTIRFWREQRRDEATIADLVAMRLLQKWTDAHALIAAEAAHTTPFAHLDESQTTIAQLEGRLEQSLRAWRLLLHPRVASALLSLSPEALRLADYRQFVDGGVFDEETHHRQDEGLIVSMAELLEAQMNLGLEIADRYAFTGAREVPDALAELQQAHLVVESLIHALAERSRDADGDYGGWNDKFRSVERRVMGDWIELTNIVDGLLEGRNPLGIEEEDLPMYFREIEDDAVSRFGAITGFLLGTTNDSDVWAASLVRSAVDAYDTAKQAYLSETSRVLNEQADLAAYTERVDSARGDFGFLMLDMCGAEAFGGASAEDVFAQIDPLSFDASTCWYRRERAECAVEGAMSATSPTARAENAALYHLCTNALAAPGPAGLGRRIAYVTRTYEGVDFRYYAEVAGWQFDSPVLKRLQEGIYANWTGFAATQEVTFGLASAACASGQDGQTVCAPGEITDTVGLLHDPATLAPINPCHNDAVADFPGLLPSIVRHEDGSYEAVCAPNTAEGFAGPTLRVSLADDDLEGLRAETSRAVTRGKIARQCRDHLPSYDPTPVASWSQAPESCYTGSVGAEVYATRTLVTDIELARDQLAQSKDAYRISMESCFLQQSANVQLMEAQESFNLVMEGLEGAKLAADVVSTWAYSTGDCLATMTGAEKPWSFGLAGGACGAYAIGSAFETASLSLETDMIRAERDHETAMMAIEQAVDEARCFKEAELELVGARSAALEIERAQQELNSAYLETQHTIEMLHAKYDAALAEVEAAEDATVLTASASPWYNEELADYERKLRLARRAAYLAVRAVEYEFQMSLSYRSDVLLAENPLAFEQVLTELRQVANTNSVSGARPAELTEVVSLKDHLLQLGDRRQIAPEGWHTMSASERFQKMLVDPAFDVYEDGVFVGRRIPFEIAPLSVLDRGQYQGVPIVSDNSCAERLWSINVTVQGEEGEVSQGVSPTVNLEVQKRNTFYSNYCDETRDDIQLASVRPTRNLFREPGVGEGVSIFTDRSEADGFSKARIQARMNIAPRDFASDAYTDGASTELATRGLFGQYALFIPATSLAPTSGGQPSGGGLVLNEVEDILLRIDYVSVAR